MAAVKKFFALEMADGTQVRDIFALKDHFDFDSVAKYFRDGKLLTWLETRYYDEEAAAVKQLDADDANFERKLCAIFGQETARIKKLKQYTADEKILEFVECVAFDQEELAYLLDEDIPEIYLCANRFVIPLRMKNRTYIGIGDAVAVIRSEESVDFAALGIEFKNVAFDDDYKKIAATAAKSAAKSAGTSDKAQATTTIVNVEGIHARPASLFVQKASSFKSKVQLSSKGKTIDAKSILPIMSAGWGFGTEVTVIAEGPDAQQAVKELVAMIDSGFGREIKRPS